ANFYARLAEFNPQVKDLPAKGTAKQKRNLKNLKATIGGEAPAPPPKKAGGQKGRGLRGRNFCPPAFPPRPRRGTFSSQNYFSYPDYGMRRH
ncbi:MAG: hypothetical protein Q7S77_01775, partial [Candidatus Staskawiczbacteria bacterium]|nr:hypothetical protein [Candidatus Staskawiczbacteria bacterium]